MHTYMRFDKGSINLQLYRFKPSLYSQAASNIITHSNFTYIQDAINIASNGHTIYVFEGDYNTNLVINKTNLTIIAYAWITNNDNTITIISNNNEQNGFYLDNSLNITIQGFAINNTSNGISIINSPSNNILNNIICSNKNKGIY